MAYWRTPSEFFEYLAETVQANPEEKQLPAMNVLSEELGVSVARLREQLEVAKALGLVDVRPRTGIRHQEFNFLPAVWQALSYAIKIDRGNFDQFSGLRKHVEMCYWYEAASKLVDDDIEILQKLIDSAWKRLRDTPIRIPHYEHREFHLAIYRCLENTFVLGILEAYWEAYEAIGLNVYADYDYLQEVWNYHQKMVDALRTGDIEAGYLALVEHTDLLHHRPGAESPEW